MKIILKSKEEISKMIIGGEILKNSLELASGIAKPGITTLEIDQQVEIFIRKSGGTPAFKGYNNYPATICSSVNEQVVHGIPTDYVLKEGDILSIDCGVKYEGFNTDAAITVNIGQISPLAKRLIEVTKNSLYLAIDIIKEGTSMNDIGSTIQTYVEKNNFYVVRDLVGHGIGKSLHEDPQIPNFASNYPLPKIKDGMTFCIEPMVNAGTADVKTARDGHTIITRDLSLSAHFEHTLAFFDNEIIIIA